MERGRERMDEKNKDFLNKTVKIFLKNTWCYTGQVLSIDEQTIEIIDKFGLRMSINRSDVSVIHNKEESQNGS